MRDTQTVESRLAGARGLRVALTAGLLVPIENDLLADQEANLIADGPDGTAPQYNGVPPLDYK